MPLAHRQPQLAVPNSPPSSGIRDNCRRGLVADFLRHTIQDGSKLSIVSAYFTIYAYDALKEYLDRIEHLDFLFGEPSYVNRLDPAKTQTKHFLITESGLHLANALQQKRVARECAEWIQRKVSIKTIRQSNLLHGKMYHVSNNGVEEAILGSSNFTVRGLGLSEGDNNIELNLVVDSNRDRQELKQWFVELWNDPKLVRDVKADVLLWLAQLYQNHAPEFIYFKTLFHIFEKYLGDTGKTDADIGRTTLFDTQVWQALFEFQKDGVKGAINKILAHNGCVLADSVGLGKTFEALAVIKYFELRNERVLVLCPKKLRDNWSVYRSNSLLNRFQDDRFRYDVLCHTDLSRQRGQSGGIDLATLNWGNYDLIVIDESHNFRNNAPGRRDEEGNVIKSRYQRLMDEIINKGVRTKVLLLSATPVNNNLRDLRNQIYFITGNDDQAFEKSLGVPSLQETLRQAQQHFTNWAKHPSEKRKTSDLLGRLGSDFFKLLDQLSIARSRKHVQKYYKDTIAKLGGFPERMKPISVSSETDSHGVFLSYDKLSEEIDGYQLSLFNPWKYVELQFRPLYQTPEHDPFTQADREKFLIGMMKVNFLKRLESSVKAFEITMERTIQKIEDLENKIKAFQAQDKKAAASGEFELDIPESEGDDELEDPQQVGGKRKYKLAHLRLDGEKGWLKDLKRDKDQLRILYRAAQDVTPPSDAKLRELKSLIQAKATKPTTNKLGEPNRKVLVFTAFADTANYLYQNLESWAHKTVHIHIALVTGGGGNQTTLGKTDYPDILTNFSPRSKERAKIPGMPQEGEIDLLIATDCISEGQNLQDCDYLINYDIHWNPVRIIQRFGRIDRIGSANHTVQLVNFWPTDDLNKYINLKNRVEARMALVDVAATLEENLLKRDDIEDLIHENLRYRDRQLLRMKAEILDIEDLNDNVSLTDFTLDDFRMDLLRYLEANREALEAAPPGLYTVVPPHPQFRSIQPGVIFCLKQLNSGEDDVAPASPAPDSKDAKGEGTASATSTVNPLQPYFLVYVLADGNVRFGFAQPKQLLEIYRLVCLEKATPFETLCALFDQETANGSNMAHYNALLEKAVASIVATFRKRLAGGLQSGRDFVIPNQHEQATNSTQFELVTWLVIKAQ